MKNFLRGLKGYMMPIAMTIGVIFYEYAGYLTFLIPYLVFVMLLLTFSKLSWHNIRITRLHIWLVAIQIFGSLAVYLLFLPFNKIVAQAALICVLAPTATAAPVITGMLSGNVESLTAYSLISNLMVAVVSPLYFTLFGAGKDLSFFSSLLMIFQHVALLVVLPVLTAYLIKRTSHKLNDFLLKNNGVSFYLWSIALIIVSGKTMQFIMNQSDASAHTEIIIAVVAFWICLFQFLTGRRVGRIYDDTVAGGQGLGQKNTILAIWMAQMYLHPLSSIGPGAYVLWQNVINSYQVWKKRKEL